MTESGTPGPSGPDENSLHDHQLQLLGVGLLVGLAASRAGSRRLLRTAFGVLIALSTVFFPWRGADATSNGTSGVNDVFNAKYATNVACIACHTNGSTSPAANVVGEITGTETAVLAGVLRSIFTPYGQALAGQITPRSGNQTALIIRPAMETVETQFAPRLTSVNGGSSAGVVQLPGASGQFPVDFSSGQDFAGGTPALQSVGATLPSGFSFAGSTATSQTVTVSLSAIERGNARRANTPFVLQFDPVNAVGFRGTTTANRDLSKVSVAFANLAPTAANDSFTTPGDQTLGGTSGSIANVLTQGIDSDPDDLAPLQVQLVQDVTLGTLTLNTDGSFVYVPPLPTTPGQRSTFFTYTVFDSEGLQSNVAQVDITILGVAANTDPVAQDDSFTILEDTVLTGNVLAANPTVADSDVDPGASLRTTVLQSPKFGAVNLQLNGKFTYTPNLDATGAPGTNIDSFDYVLSDGIATDIATVTVTITPQNDPPVANTVALSTITETQGIQTLDLLNAQFVLDADGDVLAISNFAFSIVAPPSLTSQALNPTLVGGTLRFDPVFFAPLDNNESAALTFTYDVSDGTAPAVQVTIPYQIDGLDNGVGRVAGAYANSLSSRYGGHFLGQNQANASCHTCHNVNQVNVDIDTVNQCTKTVFTEYGFALCKARNPGQQPLTDLVRRMAQTEPLFAPRLNPVPALSIDETAAVGDLIGAPVTAQAGLTVQMLPTTIVSYAMVASETPSAITLTTKDSTGQFSVDASGQLRVASRLIPGVYSFELIPINDAGQLDDAGLPRPSPGFFPREKAGRSTISITVRAILPGTVADTANTAVGTPRIIDVLANDTLGGVATGVAAGPLSAGGGTVVVQSDLTVNYTPSPGFAGGTDTFTYVASNAAGSAAAETVTVAVVSAGGVVANNDSSATPVGKKATILVLNNDTGVIAATQVSLSGPTPDPVVQGAATVDATGRFIEFDPVPGFTGTVLVGYTATNPGAGGLFQSSAVITINVLAFGSGTLAAATSDPGLKLLATAFDQSCAIAAGLPNAGPDTQSFLTQCANITASVGGVGSIDDILKALRNEEALAVADVADTIARGMGGGIRARLNRVRQGGPRGIDLGGIAVTLDGTRLPNGLIDGVAANLLGLDPASVSSKSYEAGLIKPTVGLFVSGDFTMGRKGATTTDEGFDLEAKNLLVGLDFQLDDRRLIGGALGYSASETQFDGGGALSANGFQLSGYGSIQDFLYPGAVLDGYASIGRLQFDSERRINFTASGATLDTMANASFNSTYLNVAPRLSFSSVLGRYGDPIGAPLTDVKLTWYLGLDYLRTSVDGYQESGGAGLGLTTQHQSYDSLLTTLGIEISRPIYLGPNSRIELFGGLSANAELLDDVRSVTSSFTAAGPTAPAFIVSADGSKGVYGAAELGALFKLGSGNANIHYRTDFGKNSGLQSWTLSMSYGTPIFGQDSLSVEVGRSGGQGQKTIDTARLDYGLTF